MGKSGQLSSMQRNVVKISGVDVEYFMAGEGKPLLFLHDERGLSSRNPILDFLAAQRHVVALSLPGFGQSDLPLWIDCVDDLAYIALGLLDYLKLDSVDVVGCSLGGWVAAEMASKSPQRIRRLVLAAPYGVKLGPVDRLEFPDLFALPKSVIAEKSFHDQVSPTWISKLCPTPKPPSLSVTVSFLLCLPGNLTSTILNCRTASNV